MTITDERTAERPRPRRGRVLPLMLAAFVGSAAVGGIVVSDPADDTSVSVAASCPHGEHTTFSKYSGSACAPDIGKAGRDLATVVTGCTIGAFSGTLPGLLGGCAVAGVSVVISRAP